MIKILEVKKKKVARRVPGS